MNVIGLVSGGKDSFYNLMNCVYNGHRITALANLHPSKTKVKDINSTDEIDSYMYQTVGFEAVDHYSECLNVPLYRREIIGDSLNQELDYHVDHLKKTNNSSTESETVLDETEDLFILLSEIKEKHPNVNAVSVGAILSTYQRTRVESVCSRLGLVVLSYLWRRKQDELLQEMIDCNIDARIIKVAGEGLDESDLGKSLKDAQRKLIKLNLFYGLHLCGEGGEYETLVLDCPLFVKKLVIDKSTVVKHSNDSVFYLRITKVSTQEKDYDPNWKLTFRAPNLLHYVENTNLIIKPYNSIKKSHIISDPNEVAKEAEEVFSKALKRVKNIRDVLFVSLVISDMQYFDVINKQYIKIFNMVNPPARSCIESSLLPAGEKLQAFFYFYPETNINTNTNTNSNFICKRQGLHVQSRSYWAPANIGPYSQVVQQFGMMYVSGMIPLNPSSMEMFNVISKSESQVEELFNIQIQGDLCLQHVYNVLSAGLCPDNEVEPEIQMAYNIVYITSKEGFGIPQKVWKEFDKNEFLHKNKTGMLVVQVDNLPKNANIEWSGCGINNKYIDSLLYNYDMDDDENNDKVYKISSEEIKNKYYSIFITKFGFNIIFTITIKETKENYLQEISNLIREKLPNFEFFYSGTCYWLNNTIEDCYKLLQLYLDPIKNLKNSIEFIKVHAIENAHTEKAELGIILRAFTYYK